MCRVAAAQVRGWQSEGRLHLRPAAYNLIRLPKLLEAQRDARPLGAFQGKVAIVQMDLW